MFFSYIVSIATTQVDSACKHHLIVLILLFAGDGVMANKENGSRNFTSNQDMASGWIVFAVLISALTLGTVI